MRIVKHQISLEVENNDLIQRNHKIIRHSELLPFNLRCLVIGPSNCGKTNVIISLIEHPNGLKFKNIYVYSKSLYQPKYVYLKKLLQPIKEIGYYQYDSDEDILKPSDAKPFSVFIFDDVACEKQDVIREYFSMGRHNKIDSFYLCQSYAKLPKHLLRDNANTLVLFKQDELNMKHIHRDHVGSDMTFEEFRDLCGVCWKEPFGFLTILKDCNLEQGRYRRGFDHYIYLTD